jgi:hypothetical protein
VTLLDRGRAEALTACCQRNILLQVGEVIMVVDAGDRSVVCTTHLVEAQGGRQVWSEAKHTGRLWQVREGRGRREGRVIG